MNIKLESKLAVNIWTMIAVRLKLGENTIKNMTEGTLMIEKERPIHPVTTFRIKAYPLQTHATE